MSNNGELDLGFLDPFEDAVRATSPYFPSKAGGLPAWLDFEGLPPIERLTCETCAEPLSFLLQLYAPQDDIEHAYHRTLLVFCCKKGGCHKAAGRRSFRVFRCQLARVNKYYSPDEPAKDDPSLKQWREHRGGEFARLCCVCASPAPKTCASCKKAHYCSRAHQMLHWRCGHKELCAAALGSAAQRVPFVACIDAASEAARSALFREFEISTEPGDNFEDEDAGAADNANGSASDSDGSDGEGDDQGESARLEEYRKTVEKLQLEQDEGEDEDLDDLFKKFDKSDKQFAHFEKTIKRAPEQVIRYHRRAPPLWIGTKDIPTADAIPQCACGASRTFEFQVLPQLLYYLRVDDDVSLDKLAGGIDWGVLAIFTCDANCNIAGDTKYAEEFLWRQAVV